MDKKEEPIFADKIDINDFMIDEADDAINPTDMMTLIWAEIDRKGIAGHHIDSMNQFYRVGIKQIVTNIFSIEGHIKNTRDKTEEDKEITDISYRVEFTDANLRPPSNIRYHTENAQMLTPTTARLSGLNYSAQLDVSAHITATATLKSGSTKSAEANIKSYRIAAIPCMIRSQLCHTANCDHETLKEMQEDPTNPGGYFILKGGERALISLEALTNNAYHVHRNMFDNERAQGRLISKPGDGFENTYQIILRYLTDDAITVDITTGKYERITLPFYILFRMLGITSDREIINHIVYGVDNDDHVTKTMKAILNKAFHVVDPKYAAISNTLDIDEIIRGVVQKITSVEASAFKNENVVRYTNISLMTTIDRYLLPHIGTHSQDRVRKLRFVGHMINKLLKVFMQIHESSDRDSYRNKRLNAAGISLAKAFKTDFNFAIVQAVKKALNKEFKSTPFSQVQLEDVVKRAMNTDELERMLITSMVSGNKTITIRKNEVMNRVSSQLMQYKNEMNIKSILNTVSTANVGMSKQNDRADEMRRVHPTYVGYIDVSQSPDSGPTVGIVKQLACTTSIVCGSSGFVLRDCVVKDKDLILLDLVRPEEITAKHLAKVFVNGEWIGCVARSYELAQRYREMRREGEIDRLTTIVWDPLGEVYMWTDAGRPIRPLVIVYNNLEEYNKSRADVKFRQYIKLTSDHIAKLRRRQITMNDLVDARVIEYIAAEEQENMYLAQNIMKLRAHTNDITHRFTHCDIDQAVLGIVTLASPGGDHSNTVRNTMYTNHRKQSCGWYALNYPYRFDKRTMLQHYVERPLISAFSDALSGPNGNNIIVAFAIHGGFNQEDSLIFNQSAIDRGLFNGSCYNFESTIIEQGESLGTLNIPKTLEIKHEAVYEHCVDGLVKKGTLVNKNFVLISKSAKIPKPTTQYEFVDRSIVYKFNEPARVEMTLDSSNDENERVAKVKVRANRRLGVGDKCSSRTGNKGIISRTVPENNMPYMEDGVRPSVLVNAHSIPSRMAVNQLIECLLGQLAAKKGTCIDATIFRELDIDKAVAELRELGVSEFAGHRRMYNGHNGDWIDTLIFCGPNTYQWLLKFVIDDSYAIASGPTSALTHQPIDGKAKDGGLRIGEMEKDVFAAHGAMRMLHSKFYDDSDGTHIYVCRGCSERAVVNERQGIYKCQRCNNSADIVRIPSSWGANLFFSETSGMNIKMKFHVEPFTYMNQTQ